MNQRAKGLLKSIFFFFIGFAILYQIYDSDKVYSKNELVKLKSTIRDYSFQEMKHLFKTDEHYYYIYIDKYFNRFEIPDNFVKGFDKIGFERQIRSGDSINIEVSEASFISLKTRKLIQVFGVSNNNQIFLNSKYSIEQHNSPGLNFAAAFFIITGVIFLFINVFKEDKEK